MEISAALVKELREKTGVGIMDCKQALAATNCDLEKAVDYLREKGLSAASKRAARITSEGLVSALVKDAKAGVLLEVNCETDFVAKTEQFQGFVKEVNQLILDSGIEKTDDPALEKMRQDMVVRTGENVSVRRFIRYQLSQPGRIASYVHAGGKIGVILEVDCDSDEKAATEEFALFVKDLTLHIAAANPLFLDRTEVPADVLEKEKHIYRTQALESGKPEKILDKIVAGRVEKYYSEVCLLGQPFVKDPDYSIEKLRAEKSKQMGAKITIARFVRYQLGEGLAKRGGDLAAEIEAQKQAAKKC